MCFVLALALAAVTLLDLPYVSPTGFFLSPAALWIGYLLVAAPLRYEEIAPEETGPLALRLWRRLALGTLVQWLLLVRYGPPMLVMLFLPLLFPSFFSRLFFENTTIPNYYLWKPQLFLLGALLLWGLFQLLLRRSAGREARLLPAALTPWLIWGILSLLLWQTADMFYDYVAGPLQTRLTKISPHLKEEYTALMAEQLRPYVMAKWAALAAGVLSGLGLAAFRLRKRFPERFSKKAPLAPEEES